MMKRAVCFIAAVLLCAMLVCPASAADTYSSAGEYRNIADNAGLLTDDELTALGYKLSYISRRLEADIVIVTERSVYDMQSFAEDYYDSNGYGDSGVLLLYCKNGNEAYIDTVGGCRYALNTDRQDKIFDAIAPYIRSESYSDAFTVFIDKCEMYIGNYIAANGSLSEYEYSSDSAFGLRVGWYHLAGISVIIGVIVGFIAVFVMKSKLRSVRYNGSAGNYVVRDSMNVTQSREIFLYRHVARVAKPKDNDNFGGSGGRGFSGGSRHSGSGRKF